MSNICTTKYTLVPLFYTSRNDCRMPRLYHICIKRMSLLKETGTSGVIIFFEAQAGTSRPLSKQALLIQASGRLFCQYHVFPFHLEVDAGFMGRHEAVKSG